MESYTPSPLTCHNSPTTFSSSLSTSLSLLSSSFSVSCAHLIIKDSEYRYGGTHHDLLLYLFAFLFPSSTLNFSLERLIHHPPIQILVRFYELRQIYIYSKIKKRAYFQIYVPLHRLEDFISHTSSPTFMFQFEFG